MLYPRHNVRRVVTRGKTVRQVADEKSHDWQQTTRKCNSRGRLPPMCTLKKKNKINNKIETDNIVDTSRAGDDFAVRERGRAAAAAVGGGGEEGRTAGVHRGG